MEEKTKRKRIHYAWWILVSCCFFFGASMALINSIIGVYAIPVTTALGCGRGDFYFMLTTQAVFIMASVPLWGRMYNSETANINLGMTLGAACMIACPLICSFANDLIVFYVAGAIGGIGVGCLFTMATPCLIGNWFAKKHRGKMIGIASCFAGVSTVLWSPLFNHIITQHGFHTAYLINAIVMAVLVLPWTLFVVKRYPVDKGLEPFGYNPNEVDDGDDASMGIDAKDAVKTPAFWIIILGVALTSMGMGYNNNQTGIAKEFLANGPDAANAAAVGASMISAAALGNLISKLAFGALADRIRLGVTFVIFQIVWLAAFVIWLVAGTSATALIVGGFCLGFCNAPSRVGWALAARKVFGNRDYAKIWSYFAIASSIVGGFSSSIVGWIYDGTGSYYAAIVVGMVVVVAIAVLAFVGTSYEGKISWTKSQNQ